MKASCLLISVQLLITFQVQSQDKELLKAAREIITNSETCALITIDKNGRPSARTMETLTPESDFTLWFGTNPESRKVTQIKNDPRVSVYYLDKDQSGYVVISGTAEIINAKQAKETYWKEEWNAFYPNKKEGYILIKVTPESAEIVSNSRAILGDSITWKVPTLILKE